MNSIPHELFHEICSRLPTKSIGRCRCVSNLWRSILCSADFEKLFLTKSSARPSLLLAMEGSTTNEFLFFASPQLHSQNEKSCLDAYCKLKLPKDTKLELCSHASGLFCFRHEKISKKDEYTSHVICNPITGQSVFLPKLRTGRKSFLGFDPIDKVFKVVTSIADGSVYSCIHNILILATGEMRWRRIQCSLLLSPCWSQGICINGVLYYLADEEFYSTSYIVCFDVRSENIKFIHKGFSDVYADSTRLVNYKGKLGVISWRSNHELCLWVLEDAEKHDWSEYAYTLPSVSGLCVVGVTVTGEIVFMRSYVNSYPFYVFYFTPESNTVRRVEVQGFQNHHDTVYAFVNHVDDLTLNMKPHQVQQDLLTFDMNYHQLQQNVRRFEKINKFAALSLLDDV